MGSLGAISCLILLIAFKVSSSSILPNDINLDAAMRAERALSDDDHETLLSYINTISRQAMLLQLFTEERVRTDGQSGLKQNRLESQGSKPYHTNSYSGRRIAAMHQHKNNIRTVGMGELTVVLNGHEFRTRHNDYSLVMPSKTSGDYEATEDIPFPDVPPEVLEKETLADQVSEMREFFKAFVDEDPSHRNYTDYFKATLCYMEGAWTISPEDKIEESFKSDRHFLAASSWLDLQNKIRFTSYTGKKDVGENLAFLPTTILKQENETLDLAQWNYRILCHPLSRNIPPSRLGLVDDVASRAGNGRTMDEHELSRAARYTVGTADKDSWKHKRQNYDLLDRLMEEIPGKDNYVAAANLVDDALGSTALHYETGETLKAGYYHRWMKLNRTDAMGSDKVHRTYSDSSLFMAMTTQEKVAPMSVESCDNSGKNCVTNTQRWTYCIPLEIIYLTPLLKWNPHKLVYKGSHKSAEGLTVTVNGRNGGEDLDKALDGIHNKLFYQTPISFFEAEDSSDDEADTAKGSVYVLSADGTEAYQTVATGTPITLPEIPGVGIVRTRYPIMPAHVEGNAIWKELAALRDIVLNPFSEKDKYYEDFPVGEPTGFSPQPPSEDHTVILEMELADENYSSHIHYVFLTPEEVNYLATPDTNVTVTTSKSWGHTHELVLVASTRGRYQWISCDQFIRRCWDGAARWVVPYE